MNAVDIAIISVTGISCLFGLWRGFVKEVLSLVSWVAALLLARIYSETFSETLAGVISNEGARYLTAFVLIFIAVMMIGTLVNSIISKLLSATGLNFVNRLFGGVFGIVRGAVIVLVILFICNIFVSETALWQESQLIPYGMSAIDWSRTYIEGMGGLEMPEMPGQTQPPTSVDSI